MKFGVPPPPAGARWRAAAVADVAAARRADATTSSARLGTTKALMMAFQDKPSDTVDAQYNDLKLALPKAIVDGNAFLVKAMTLSQALKKSDITLTVPAPVK